MAKQYFSLTGQLRLILCASGAPQGNASVPPSQTLSHKGKFKEIKGKYMLTRPLVDVFLASSIDPRRVF